MPVYRTRPLPVADPVGRLIVPSSVVSSTGESLRAFCGASGRHEGLVFWVGRRVGTDSIVVGSIVPACHHGPQRVQADSKAVGQVMKRARAAGLGIIAQVHSHPGNDTRHSDGDDDMILMPFDGMFSLVVGRYGNAPIAQEGGVGVHQYQSDRWMQIPPSCEVLVIVPNTIPL